MKEERIIDRLKIEKAETENQIKKVVANFEKKDKEYQDLKLKSNLDKQGANIPEERMRLELEIVKWKSKYEELARHHQEMKDFNKDLLCSFNTLTSKENKGSRMTLNVEGEIGKANEDSFGNNGQKVKDWSNLAVSMEKKEEDEERSKIVAIISDSLMTGIIKSQKFRNILESREHEIRIYPGGTIDTINGDKERWDIGTADIVVLSVGSNDICNNCVDVGLYKDELKADARGKNKVEIFEIVKKLMKMANEIKESGKEVLVVTPPPRKNEKTNEYRTCEDMICKEGKNEGIEIINWGEIIRKEENSENLYYDNVHFNDNGRDILWSMLCSSLKRKGVRMDLNHKAMTWLDRVVKGACLACGEHGHKKYECRRKDKECSRCGAKDDHMQEMCRSFFLICTICGKYAHSASKCKLAKK